MNKRHRYLLITIFIGFSIMSCKTISEPVNDFLQDTTPEVNFRERRVKTTASDIDRQNDGSELPSSESEFEVEDQITNATSVTGPTITEGTPELLATQQMDTGGEPYPGPEETIPVQISPSPTITETPDTQVTPQNTLTPSSNNTPVPTNTLTEIEVPPWIESEISASDPSAVELVSGSYQFIEFFAYWCGSCLALAPEIHTLESHYSDRINFIYLDIDDPANDTFKEELNFQQQPQFFLLDPEGEVIQQFTGYVLFQELVNAFESVLNTR